MADRIKVDKNGFSKYEEKLDALKKELDELRLYKGKDAIYQGDNWHDNPTLNQAEMMERNLMLRIKELKNLLNNAELIVSNDEVGIVSVGDKVVIELLEGSMKSEMLIKIVGGPPSENSEELEVSVNSPIGSAVLNNAENHCSSYSVGEKKFNFCIKRIIKNEVVDHG